MAKQGLKYTMQTREIALNEWLKSIGMSSFTMVPLAGDASFRRYYRLHMGDDTRIIMDAPPEKEALTSFLKIGTLLSKNDVYTPRVYATNQTLGFALLEDLGDELLFNVISQKNVDKLYALAMKTVMTIQRVPLTTQTIPSFDKTFILNELNVFREWFLTAYLNLPLSTDEGHLLDQTFETLASDIAHQPQVLIHRDYHSRNLLLTHKGLGVIDFQDAMKGSYAYDLVSLLKDCYLQWPEIKIKQWVTSFYDLNPLVQTVSLPEFHRAFDLCGLQRHLKVLGVFCRLHLRDHKSGYLRDLPLTFHYVMACLEGYKDFKAFYQWMEQTVQVAFLHKHAS